MKGHRLATNRRYPLFRLRNKLWMSVDPLCPSRKPSDKPLAKSRAIATLSSISLSADISPHGVSAHSSEPWHRGSFLKCGKSLAPIRLGVFAKGVSERESCTSRGGGGGSEGPLKKFMTSKSGTVWGCQMGGYDYLTLKCARSAQL